MLFVWARLESPEGASAGSTILDLKGPLGEPGHVHQSIRLENGLAYLDHDKAARVIGEQAMNKPTPSDGDADIVLLTVAQSEVEGMMLANAVRDAGINVLVKPGGPGMGAWASSATFEHRLYVRQDRLAEARGVLEGGIDLKRQRPRARKQAPNVNARRRHRSE